MGITSNNIHAPAPGQQSIFILHHIPQTFWQGGCADLPTLRQTPLLGESMGKFLFPGWECDPVTGRPGQPGVRVHLQGLPLHPQGDPSRLCKSTPRGLRTTAGLPPAGRRCRAKHLHVIRARQTPPASPPPEWLHSGDTSQRTSFSPDHCSF